MNTLFLCRHCRYIISTSRTQCPACESKDLLPASPQELVRAEPLPHECASSSSKKSSIPDDAVAEYYTSFPFGEVLTRRVRGEHTSHPQIWTYQYETDTSAAGYSRLKSKTYPGGSHVNYSYDANGRIRTKCEPWAGGGHKVMRITYDTDSPDQDASRHVRYFILDDKDTEFLLSETRYLVTETPCGKKEEVWQTAAGSSVRQYSSREWYSENDENPLCRGKLKITRDVNGVQHFHEYLPEREYNSLLDSSPVWTHVDTLMAADAVIPGQSTQIRETFHADGHLLHLREYVHDGTEFILIRSDRFAYNDRGQLVRRLYGNGMEQTTAWFSCFSSRTIDVFGTMTEFEYDSLNRLILTTKRNAVPKTENSTESPPQFIRNEYDKDGRLRSRTEIQGKMIMRTLRSYDSSGRLSSETDSEGLTTAYSYSPDELVTMITHPSGAAFTTQRHERGAILCEGGTGRRTRFHLYSITHAGIREQIRLDRIDGPVEEEKLTNGFGQLILTRQATGSGLLKETAFAYNEKGQKVEERTCGQSPLLLGYDKLGQLSGKMLLPLPVGNGEGSTHRRLETLVTRYCRDDFDPGDPAEEDESRQPLMYRKEIRAVYNEQGKPVLESKAVKVSAIDMLESESQIVYLDKYNQYSVLDTSLDDETGELTSYSYLPGSPYTTSRTCLGDQLIRQKERDGRSTRHTCRLLSEGREFTITGDSGQRTILCHDLLGRQISSIDHRGNKMTRVYDKKTGLLTRESRFPGDTRKWSYDGRGRLLLEQTDSGSEIRYEYDASGQLVMLCQSGRNEEQNPLSPEKEILVRFSYDDASGALLQMQFAGQRTSYEYDRNGRPSRIVCPSGKQTEFRYTQDGELDCISFSDGTPALVYEYGTTGRLRRICSTTGIYDFFLSAANDMETVEESCSRTRLTHLRDILGRPAGHLLSQKEIPVQDLHMDYDPCNRIKSLRENGRSAYRFTWHPGTGDLSGIAYPHGMRKQWIPENKNTGCREVKYLFPHTLPPLTFATPPPNIHQGQTEEYLRNILVGQHQPAVLETKTGTWNIEYNALPLPSLFRQEDRRITFLYDYRGRRVEKAVYHKDILEERLRYVYSGDLLLAEFDATAGEDTLPLLLCSYIWSPVSPSPLSMTLWKDGIGTICHYLHDADNNIRGLVDEECRLRAAYEYAEDGRMTSISGDLAEINPFRYGSSYYDEDLGIYHSRFRLAGPDKSNLPPGAPLPPSFHDICEYPFTCLEELDNLFADDRRQTL